MSSETTGTARVATAPAALTPLHLLQNMDDWLSNTGHDDAHPWRVDITRTLAAHGASSAGHRVGLPDDPSGVPTPAQPLASRMVSATAGAGRDSPEQPSVSGELPRCTQLPDLIGLLFSRARDGLQPGELAAIADGASEQAQHAAASAAAVVEAIGCLVAADGTSRPGASAGNFQSANDVPGLMWHLAGQFRQIEALTLAAGLALDALSAGRGGPTA